jgi:hypothetical protein
MQQSEAIDDEIILGRPNGKCIKYDVLPSSLLDPSWVQISQTTKLFGTRGHPPSS